MDLQLDLIHLYRSAQIKHSPHSGADLARNWMEKNIHISVLVSILTTLVWIWPIV